MIAGVLRGNEIAAKMNFLGLGTASRGSVRVAYPPLCTLPMVTHTQCEVMRSRPPPGKAGTRGSVGNARTRLPFLISIVLGTLSSSPHQDGVRRIRNELPNCDLSY
jgi:hypothetical protein